MRNTYTRFLCFLMFNRVLDSKTITLYFGDDTKASRYRKKAINNNHIKKRSVTEHSDGRRAESTIYTLTKQGFQYLSERDQNIIALLQLDDLPLGVTFNAKTESGVQNRMRQARKASAVVIADRIGASIPIQNYTSIDNNEYAGEAEDAAQQSVMEYLAQTMTNKAYQSIGLYKHTDPSQCQIAFYNASCVKSFANVGSSHVSTAADYISGRFSGVMESQDKTVMIFVPPSFGMGWYTWITRRERAAYNIWTKRRQVTPIDKQKKSGACAALVVDNPRDFYNIYRDTKHKQQSDTDEFGGEFDHVYIVPLSVDGAKHLRWLMTTDDQAINSRIATDAIRSGAYKKYTGAYESLFPLMNVSNNRVALGFQFDGKHLLKVENFANKFPHEQIEFLCADWQVPYYERVLPENVHLTGMKMG